MYGTWLWALVNGLWFFDKRGKPKNETDKLNPDHNFFPTFPFQDFFFQFLNKRLKTFLRFAQIISFKKELVLCCFQIIFRHQIAQFRGQISKKNLSGGALPPAAANFQEVCAVMCVNRKKIQKSTSWGWNDFLERGGGRNYFKTKYTPLTFNTSTHGPL